MLKLVPILICAASLAGAADPWTKVQELKSGSELRIVRRGDVKPLLATLEEVHEDSLVVATKTEELAIPKSSIDRLDARPPHSGTRVHKETKTTETGPDFSGPGFSGPGNQARANRPNQSSSTSLSFGAGKDFETVYRRTASSIPAKPADSN